LLGLKSLLDPETLLVWLAAFVFLNRAGFLPLRPAPDAGRLRAA